MLNTKNNIAARMGYEAAKTALFMAWIDSFKGDAAACNLYIDSTKLSQSTLRFETLLTANNSILTFGVTPQQQSSAGVPFLTEVRLNQTDTFVVSSYAVQIGLPTTALANDVNWRPKSYANPVEFGADAPLINNIFFGNSNLKITVNNDVLLPNSDLQQNLYIPETQATAAPGAGSPLDEIVGATDGFVSVEPNVYFVGPRNNVVQIILPTSIAALTNTTVRAVITCRGYTAQNSTVMA